MNKFTSMPTTSTSEHTWDKLFWQKRREVFSYIEKFLDEDQQCVGNQHEWVTFQSFKILLPTIFDSQTRNKPIN